MFKPCYSRLENAGGVAKLGEKQKSRVTEKFSQRLSGKAQR